MSIRALRPAIALAALVAATLGPAAAERVEKEFHESFDVQPGARLHLEHGDGDVTITPWDRSVVQVDVVYRAEVGGWGAGKRDFDVRFSRSGQTIRVTGREQGSVSIGLFHTREREYTYDVKAPPWVELQLAGEDGHVEIAGWRASIRATLDDGDLRLEDVEADDFDLRLEDGDALIEGLVGRLLLEVDDGDVELRDSRVEARIYTEDGDVYVRRSRGDFEVRGDDAILELIEIAAGSVDVETEDGDVEIELAESDDLRLVVRAEDGDVGVTCPHEVSAEVDIRTGDGRIRLDLPGGELERERRRVTGRLGAGAGTIEIITGDGDVTLRQAGPPRVEAEPAAADD